MNQAFLNYKENITFIHLIIILEGNVFLQVNNQNITIDVTDLHKPQCSLFNFTRKKDGTYGDPGKASVQSRTLCQYSTDVGVQLHRVKKSDCFDIGMAQSIQIMLCWHPQLIVFFSVFILVFNLPIGI